MIASVTVVDAMFESVITDPVPRITTLPNVEPETVALFNVLLATVESLSMPPLMVDVLIVELVDVAEESVELLTVEDAMNESVDVANISVELLIVDVAIYELSTFEYVTSETYISESPVTVVPVRSFIPDGGSTIESVTVQFEPK